LRISKDQVAPVVDLEGPSRMRTYGVEKEFGADPGRPSLERLVGMVSGDEETVVRHEAVNGEGMVVNGQHPLVLPHLADAAHGNHVPLLEKVMNVSGMPLGLSHEARAVGKRSAD